MTVDTLLYIIARTLFILLVILTVVDYWRYRDRVHLYTALLLGTLALNFTLGAVSIQPPWSEIILTVLWLTLLSHPFIFLLLVQQFRPVHPLVPKLARAGLFISWLVPLLAIVVNLPTVVTLPIPIYFIGIETYAIVVVWRGALQARGVTRPRLLLVAAASALLVLIIILFALSLVWTAAAPTLNLLILVLAVFVALGYYLGFVPPRSLNRTWQLTEVHHFLEEVAVYPPEERALMVSNLLRKTAMRVTEAADTAIACWAERDELLIVDGSPLLINMVRQLDTHSGLVGRIWQTQQAETVSDQASLSEIEQEMLAALRVNALLAIPVATRERVWGVLLVFLIRRPIFETADSGLLTLLAQQMANTLSYTALLAEQHMLIDKLNRREMAVRQAHEQTQILAQVASQLNAQIELKASLSAICEAVAQMFAVPMVTISLYDEAEKALYLAHDYGLPDIVRQRLRVSPRVLDDAYAQLAAPVMVTPDVRQLKDLQDRDLYEEIDVRTTANATMWYGTVLIGRLNIGTIGQMRQFKEQELTLLKGVADQAAIAIHRASLYQQVQQHAAQLEQHVAERTAELQARNRELDAFAHTVAHDLKSPLALISGFTELLIDDFAHLHSDEVAKLLDYVSVNSRKMSEIIDALLLLASTREEEVALEAVDMGEIIANVQHRLTYMVEKYDVKWTVPAAWPMVMGYGPWIEEAWANYITNAIKYGGRPPQVQLGMDKQTDNGQMCFWVRDNGPGIPLDEQSRLFVPFTKLSEEPAESSHGLGLSIVERIVRRLGGTVGCHSHSGEGSKFYFTLPTVPNHR